MSSESMPIQAKILTLWLNLKKEFQSQSHKSNNNLSNKFLSQNKL